MENKNTEANAGTIAAPAALITVKRADLADALKTLKFKSAKHSIPILNYIAAEVSGAVLVLKSTDLQTAITYKIQAIANTAAAGAAFCLRLAALESAIKGAPKKGDIELKYQDGAAALSWPELSGGSFPIDSQPAQDFPIIPEAGTEKLEGLRGRVNYDDMQALYNALSFTASREDDRHFLNGIFFDGKEAVTTDGRRLAILPFPFDFKPVAKENGVIIPTEAMKRAAKAGAGTMFIYANMVYFKTPKMSIASRTIEGNFPAYKQILPKTWEMISTLDGAALLPVLSSLPEINKGRLGITFLFTAAGYELYFKNEKIAAFPLIEGAGHFKEKPFKISFNPAFVRDILAAAPGNVQMRLNNASQPAGLFNGSGAEYVIMPLRTEGAGGSLGAKLAEIEAAAKPAEGAQDAPAVPEAPEGQAEAPAAPEAAQDAPAAVQEAPAPVQDQESGKEKFCCAKCGAHVLVKDMTEAAGSGELICQACADQEKAPAPVPARHSRGAVKVAQALTGYEYEESKTIETPAGYKTCKGIADMIDQETGAADLLAALEALTEWGCTNTSPRDSNSPHELLIKARAAIQKAGGGALDTTKYPAI